MNIKLLAATFAAGSLLVAAGAASAGTVLTVTPIAGDAIPAGEKLITDFNSTGGSVHSGNLGSGLQGGAINDLRIGYSFSQDSGAYTRDGVAGLDPSVSAPPPLDNGIPGAYYETILNGGSATLTSVWGLKQFSFYMGSPDDYNHITFTFIGVNGSVVHKDGVDVWGGAPPGNGDQSFGTTVVYTFGPEAVKTIKFSSTGNSFEVDKFAGIALPEPASWALMIMGFGFAGGMIRAKRRAEAAA